MFIKRSIFIFLPLFWMVDNQSPANGHEADCQYYHSRSLKKNVYTTVEIEPEFPGGAAAYVRFLNRNLRIAEDAVDDVTSLPMPMMQFIVDTDGKIVNAGIQGKSDTTHFNSLEKATLEFIKKMPKWKPGRCNGKIVAVEVNRPLAICLRWEIE